MSDQEQNTVQTPSTSEGEDFTAWKSAREAELKGEPSGAAKEKPAAESAEETETSETKEEPKGEEPAGEDLEGDSEKPKDEEKPKRKGGFQKRIDRLTRENRELAERLAALEKGKTVEPEAKPAAEDKPKSEDFDDFDQFADALTDWKLRQHDTAKATKEAEAKAKAEDETRKQKAAEGWNGRVAEARKQFEDYDAVLEGAADIEVPQELEAALLEAGPAVLYHFAKNPEEAERIAELPTTSALREIGKIEAKLAAAPAPKPKTKTTSAPKPITPVGGNGGNRPSIYDKDLGEDIAEYRERKRLSR